jgi:hypothetical protein
MCVEQACVLPIMRVEQAYIYQNMCMGQVDVVRLYNSSYVFGLAPKQFNDDSLIKWRNKSHIGEKKPMS